MQAPPPPRERPKTLLAITAFFALATLLYATLVIRHFDGPLVGREDTNTQEYFGFFVLEHLRFGLGARLTFDTDAVFYPYGTVAVFQAWGFERDLFYAALRALLGQGPWLAIYYALSIAIASFGLVALLRGTLGAIRASFVAFAAVFMNFYAAFKWPHHMNISVVHWMLLNVAADFVLAKRVASREPIGAMFVALRLALVPLLFGLDLGYVAGYALASFVLTALFVAALVLRDRTRFALEDFGAFARSPSKTLGIAALLVLGLYFYFPMTVDVLRASKRFAFDGPGGNFWASQARLAFPYLPFVHPESRLVETIFGSVEGIGEFIVGWALVGAAIVGVVDARRRRTLAAHTPLLALFLLCFAYHPARFPTLRIFPWFAFNRVAGRATIVFPLLFALLASEIDWRRRTRAVVVLGALAIVETVTAYALVLRHRDDAHVTPEFTAFMSAVGAANGEAVFDWPFCVAGANGVATNELCPFYARNANIYANRRFHGKKVVGQYMNRLHPSQAEPYLRAGFAELYAPDVADPHRATRQTRCFDDREWRFFDDFFAFNDFAGLNLYVDLLPGECVAAFHARYGEPTARATLDRAGRVEFIPKPPNLRARVDPIRGRAVTLDGER